MGPPGVQESSPARMTLLETSPERHMGPEKAAAQSLTSCNNHDRPYPLCSTPKAHAEANQHISTAFGDFSFQEVCYLWDHASMLFQYFDWESAIRYFGVLATACRQPLIKSLLIANMGIIACHLGEYAIAEDLFNTSSYADDTICLHYFLSGMAAYEQEEYQAAKAAFQSCIAEFASGRTMINYGNLRLGYVLALADVIENEESAGYELHRARKVINGRSTRARAIHRLPGGRIFEAPAWDDTARTTDMTLQQMQNTRRSFLRASRRETAYHKRSSSLNIPSVQNLSLHPPMSRTSLSKAERPPGEPTVDQPISRWSVSTQAMISPDKDSHRGRGFQKTREKVGKLFAHGRTRSEKHASELAEDDCRATHTEPAIKREGLQPGLPRSPRSEIGIVPALARFLRDTGPKEVPFRSIADSTFLQSNLSDLVLSNSNVRDEHTSSDVILQVSDKDDDLRPHSIGEQDMYLKTHVLKSNLDLSTPTPSICSETVESESGSFEVDTPSDGVRVSYISEETMLLPMVYRPPVPDSVLDLLSHITDYMDDESEEFPKLKIQPQKAAKATSVPHESQQGKVDEDLAKNGIDPINALLAQLHCPGSTAASIFDGMSTPSRLSYARGETLRILESRDMETLPFARLRCARQIQARDRGNVMGMSCPTESANSLHSDSNRSEGPDTGPCKAEGSRERIEARAGVLGAEECAEARKGRVNVGVAESAAITGARRRKPLPASIVSEDDIQCPADWGRPIVERPVTECKTASGPEGASR